MAEAKAPVEDVRELKPEQLIQRELKAGERQKYVVNLKAGEYIKLVIKDFDIEFVVDVLDPQGNAVAKIALGGVGPTDSLWMLAKTAGDFQIRIAAVEAKGSPGRYSLSLETVAESETASASDLAHLRVHQAYWEATLLSDQGSDSALRQAADKYQTVLSQWRELGDRLGEAFTLHMLGFAYDRLHDPPKAIEFYEQALSIWQTLETHHQAEANTLYNLGGTYSFFGRVTEAMKCYQEALALRRRFGNQSGTAYALNNLGQVYINSGEFQAALNAHQEARHLRHEIGDVAGEARSLSNISGVYFRLGELQKALDYCLQALPLRRAAGDSRGEAVTLTNIGSIYRELGEPQEALGYYQEALSLIRRQETHRSEDRYTEGTILNGIGRSHYDLGDYVRALENYNQSLSIRRTPIEPYGEAATLTNIGNVYAKMGDREKALAYFEQSLGRQRQIGDRWGQALTLQRAGELYQQSHDLKKAREYFDEGLVLSRAIQNRSYEANLLYDIARTEKDAGHLVEARSQIGAAIAIVESARARVSSTDLRASFLASKQDFYELDIDLLMQSFRQHPNQENLVEAFSISEQRRARSLLESLAEARVQIRRGVSPELLEREREMRARLNQKAESQIKLLSGKYTAEQASALAKDIDKSASDYEQLLTEIRVSSPLYASLTQPVPLSLIEIQKEILDPDTLLLEYSLGNEHSYLWAITTTDISGYELPGRAEIENQARDIYGLLTARNQFVKFEKPDERLARIVKADEDYYQNSRRLSQMLLGPVEAKLKGKRLLIVADGALQYLPFGALPTPTANPTNENKQAGGEPYRPLIADHEITNLPSASILQVLRREVAARKPAPKTVAVLADPVFGKNDERVIAADRKPGDRPANPHQAGQNGDPGKGELVRAVRDIGIDNELEIARLPFTRNEARSILDMIPRSERFAALDFSANRAAAISPELGKYRIVHFATHGLLNTTHPGLSGLIFSLVDRQGNDQDGFLPAHEVFDLDLPADLVVLSGCRTGLGKEIKGEGILGLTRGFMYAGAARVAVSLWDVNDKSTAELMTRFYGGMLGKKHLSPAAALREAQIAMWKSSPQRAPYYWGVFVLQGEYR